jgi:hypothetical protein
MKNIFRFPHERRYVSKKSVGTALVLFLNYVVNKVMHDVLITKAQQRNDVKGRREVLDWCCTPTTLKYPKRIRSDPVKKKLSKQLYSATLRFLLTSVILS